MSVAVGSMSAPKMLEGAMNATHYEETIKTHLLPHYRLVSNGKLWFPIFIQDGLPAHHTRAVTKRLDDLGIDRLACEIAKQPRKAKKAQARHAGKKAQQAPPAQPAMCDFEFPPNSPDLNPIEQTWAHIKRLDSNAKHAMLARGERLPTKKEDIIQHVADLIEANKARIIDATNKSISAWLGKIERCANSHGERQR
jgi:transposase